MLRTTFAMLNIWAAEALLINSDVHDAQGGRRDALPDKLMKLTVAYGAPRLIGMA
jgi:hypothetical protein